MHKFVGNFDNAINNLVPYENCNFDVRNLFEMNG